MTAHGDTDLKVTVSIADILVDVRAHRDRLAKQLADLDAAIEQLERLDGGSPNVAPGSKSRGGGSMRPPKPAGAKKTATVRLSPPDKRPCGCGAMGRHMKTCKLTSSAAAAAPFKRGPYGRVAAPGEKRCEICGRADLKSLVSWHFAPEPCGLPCAGGPPPKSKEDAPDGVHSRRNCPRCVRKAVSA